MVTWFFLKLKRMFSTSDASRFCIYTNIWPCLPKLIPLIHATCRWHQAKTFISLVLIERLLVVEIMNCASDRNLPVKNKEQWPCFIILLLFFCYVNSTTPGCSMSSRHDGVCARRLHRAASGLWRQQRLRWLECWSELWWEIIWIICFFQRQRTRCSSTT